MAEGFDFKGSEIISVMAPVFAAIQRPTRPTCAPWPMKVLPDELANRLRDTRLFINVDTPAADAKPPSRGLRIETTIIEYEQGGNAARLFAGVFGGGQPVIKVRGQVVNGEKLECIFEVRRSGVSPEARAVGHTMSNEDIQREDIHDLAISVADLFRRVARQSNSRAGRR